MQTLNEVLGEALEDTKKAYIAGDMSRATVTLLAATLAILTDIEEKMIALCEPVDCPACHWYRGDDKIGFCANRQARASRDGSVGPGSGCSLGRRKAA